MNPLWNSLDMSDLVDVEMLSLSEHFDVFVVLESKVTKSLSSGDLERDISVVTKVVDWVTDQHCHPKLLA